MLNKQKYPVSLALAVFFSVLVVYLRFYTKPVNMLTWDVFGYYLYLPALFIYHDLGFRDMSWLKHIMDQYDPSTTLYQLCSTPDNHLIIKYSMGTAILYSPWFFAANWLAPAFGYARDGFSYPYQLAQVIGGISFSVAGIFMLRKVLLRFFNDRTTAISLVLIVAGTNTLDSAFRGTLMTHNYLFLFYSLVIWFSIRWHEKQSMSYAAILGFLIGFATLIRPTDGLVILIPLFWNVWDKDSLRKKIALFRLKYRQVLVFLLMIILTGLPQMIYWKIYANSFFYYSYVNPGEGFDFLYPHTPKFLFSFRKGWFLYTPLMIFAMAGFYYMWKQEKNKTGQRYALTFLLFFLVYLYVVSSWTCWWYAGCFSQRAMIQAYPVLAIPLGFFINHILSKNKTVIGLWTILFSLLLFLNLFQTWQIAFGWVLPADRITAAYYFRTFGRTSFNPDDLKYLSVDHSYVPADFMTNEKSYTATRLDLNDFEKASEDTKGHLCDSLAHSGKYSYRLDSVNIYSPAYKLRYKDLTNKEFAVIRASVWVYPVCDPGENPASLVVTFNHAGGDYNYHASDIEKPPYHLVPGQWNKVSLDYMTPDVRNGKDQLMVYFWHRGKRPLFIDDLEVVKFEK